MSDMCGSLPEGSGAHQQPASWTVRVAPKTSVPDTRIVANLGHVRSFTTH